MKPADLEVGRWRCGGACGAANGSEVAQKIRAHGRNWDLARSSLLSYGVRVEAVTADGGCAGIPAAALRPAERLRSGAVAVSLAPDDTKSYSAKT
jgi:hypothetical protein